MSNYNFENFRDEGQFIVGGEVINGTGQVVIKVHQDPGSEDCDVYLAWPAGRVLDLAKFLADQAHEAMRVKWKEDNLA